MVAAPWIASRTRPCRECVLACVLMMWYVLRVVLLFGVRRYKEVVETVLRYKDSKDKQIR